jgi:hypothetical protein
MRPAHNRHGFAMNLLNRRKDHAAQAESTPDFLMNRGKPRQHRVPVRIHIHAGDPPDECSFYQSKILKTGNRPDDSTFHRAL